jgi:predicted nucleotidyltransferase component of viral defense system
MYWNTVSPLLSSTLKELMQEDLFADFVLVGGTALSLQFGHRLSVDIDLFTSKLYGTIDFNRITKFLESKYPYCHHINIEPVSFGKSYKLGLSFHESLKVDIYYTDDFVFDLQIEDGIRMASHKEIIAMKMEIIKTSGRKKDFWDLHYFIDEYTVMEMIDFHKRRYPYSDDEYPINQLTNFELADTDFEPDCLLNKHWAMIKLDILDWVNG